MEFMKKFLDKDISGVYLFDSEEEFLTDSIIEEAKNQVSIPDFNFIDLKGGEDYEVIKNSIETLPVMEDKKIIILRNIDLSKGGLKNYKDLTDHLTADIDNFPEYASLFIISDNPPFKGKFYKKLAKMDSVVKIARLDKNELKSFIGKKFTRANKKIKKSLIDDIINRFSYLNKDSEIKLYDVSNTIDKIIANSTDEIVTAEDVKTQLNEILNLNIFNLTDALSSKDGKRAIKVYETMRKSGEDLFMIYHMIIRQIRILTCVKSLLDGYYNDSFIMKTAKIGAYELRKSKNFVNNFTIDELIDVNDRLLDMEIRQKSQDFDMRDELIKLIAFIGKN